MKKIYEVMTTKDKCGDEWSELLTEDLQAAKDKAETERAYNCDKKYHVELREYKVPDDFSIEAYKDSDDEMIDIFCNAACCYNTIEF